MCQIMHSWAPHCCRTPTTGPSSQPPWTTPCGSTALSAATSGCCTSVKAPGQVRVFHPPPRVKIPPVCVTKQSFGCIIHGRGGLMRCPCCVPQGEAEGWFKGACGGETERWQPPVLRRESSELNLWQSPASYKHIPEIVLICIFLITCISLNLWKCNILNVPSLNSIYFKMFLLKKT